MPASSGSSADRGGLGATAFLAAAVAFGLASEYVRFGLGNPRRWLPDLVVGLVLVVAGTYASRRQKGTGVLLGAAGLAWWLANIVDSALYLHRGPLLHAVVTYPGWRTPTRWGAALLAAGYAAACAPGLAGGDLGTALFGVGVAGIAVTRLAGTRGTARRLRWAALRAGLAILVGTTGAAAVRAAAGDGAQGEPMSLLYGASLAAAATFLARGLRAPSTGAIADLVVELGEPRSAPLRDELARLLGDPSLEVGFQTAGGAFIDSRGDGVDLPRGDPDRVATFVDRGGASAAVIVHDRALLADGGLLDAVASVARLSVENAGLNAQARSRVADLVASRRRLVAATDDERRRLAERLRTGAGSRLVVVEALLNDASADEGLDPDLAEWTVRALDQLRLTRRDLAAVALGLTPWEEGSDLKTALEALAQRSPLPVDVDVAVAVADGPVATAVYYVCAEAVTNAVKHASAERVTIQLAAGPDAMRLVVADDGVGGADVGAGTGLTGLADRVAALGGTLTVDSMQGAGTRLVAGFPTPSD